MKKIITLLTVAFSLSIIAPTTHAYDGWSRGKVTKIRIQSSRVLITQAGSTNPGNCEDASYLHLLQGDSAFHKNMYSAVLTAYAAGKTVRFALTGCQIHPVITEVWVE